MKTCFIFLCLFISSGLARAATQATANQDKPARLYVKSFSESTVESETISNAYYVVPHPYDPGSTNFLSDSYTYSDNFVFQDGVPGSFPHRYNEAYSWSNPNTVASSYTINDVASILWLASIWPNISGTYTEVRTVNTTVPSPPSSATSTNNSGYFSTPTDEEQCSLKMSWNSDHYYIGYYNYENVELNNSGMVSHSTHTTIKLQTGGKSTSKIRNLFGLNVSYAFQHNYVLQPDNPGLAINQYAGWSISSYTPILLQNITIGSYGAVNANGTKYVTLPDNADVDVTPYVAGVDYYSFNLNPPQKYHSYFDLFVQQANPGYSLNPVGDVYDVGHAFWRFRTEAPSDALQYISSSLTAFLGKKWGFYPTNNPSPGLLNGWTVPGFVEDDSTHSTNICRTFYIGFGDLLDGLEFTRGISLTPPEWSATGYNCANAARGAGFAADIFGLPWDTTPQNFGVTLIQMYPAPSQIIGPFIDTADIFYSSAPY